MASQGPSSGSETVDLLYLLAKDYSAFSRNERVQWYAEHIVHKDFSFKTCPDTFTVLHHTSRDGKIFDKDKVELQQRYDKTASRILDPELCLDFRREELQQHRPARVDGNSSHQNHDNSSFHHHRAPRPADEAVVLPSGARVSPVASTRLETHPGMITSQTRIRTFAAKYRLVFVLDASPSMVVIDPLSGEVVLDQVLAAFEKSLYALIAPICIPGAPALQFKPQIYISVLAQGGTADSFRVLLHGAYVTEKNITSHIAHVNKTFKAFENVLSAKSAGHSFGDVLSQSYCDMGSLLQNATVSLKLLPADACPGVILITDGTSTLPENASSYDNLIMLMNREDISCSVIQVGTMKFLPNLTLGLVTDSDSLQHLANSTFGVLLTKDEIFQSSSGSPPAPGGVDLRCSPLQFDLLSRPVAGPAGVMPSSLPTATVHQNKSLVVAERPRHVTSDTRSTVALEQLTADEFIVWDLDKLRGTMANDYPFPWRGVPPHQPLFSVMVRQYQIPGIPYMQLVDCRCREGFHLQSVSVQENSVIIKLILPWKTHIKALYTLKSSMAHSAAPEIGVTVDVLAYYDFIQQFTVAQRSSMSHSGTSRESSAAALGSALNGQQTLALRFQQLLGQISETDRLLAYLATQSQQALRPLWEPLSLPGGASAAALAKPHSEKQFWKVLSGLTKNAWHRWFRADRLEIVLNPDGSLQSDVIDFRKIQSLGNQSHQPLHPHSANIPIGSVGLVTPNVAQYSMAALALNAGSGNNSTGSDMSDLSSGSHAGGSLSSQSEALRLKFRHSLKELIKYFTKWATLSHSRHTFARILNYNDPKLQGTPSWSSVRPPAFCVVRLSWDASNLCILNSFFFGVSPYEKSRILSDLRSDLTAVLTSEGQRAFSLCQKPLRLVAIRYNTPSLPSTPSNPTTPSLARASSAPSGLNLPSAAPMVLLSESSLLDDDEPTEFTVSAPSSRLSLQSPIQSPAQTPSLPHPNSDSPLTSIVKSNPSFSLLKHFLIHRRWIWNMATSASAATHKAAADAFVKTRIREGWTLVQMSNESHLFFQEIELQPFAEFVENLSYTNVRSKCIVQYLVSIQDGHLVTELWVEPFDGLTTEPSPERRLFRLLSSLIFDIDQHLVSSIFSFDTISNAISKGDFSLPTAPKLQNLSDRVVLVTPQFELRSVADLGTRHDETFVAFDVDCSSPEQRDRQSSLLHGVLRHILSSITDLSVPNTSQLLQGSACFAKLVNPNEIDLAFLLPLDFPSSASGGIGGNSTSSASSSGSSNASALVGNSPLKVSIIHCFRGTEPPATQSRQLRDLLRSGRATADSLSLVLHDRFVPISQSTLAFCDALQYEYRRGFVKALYTQLRDGYSICASDFEYALQACKEFSMEIDLTQFARIVRRLPEGLRRSGGNKTGSQSSKPSNQSETPEDGYDVEKDFNDTLSKFFQRVPHSQWHFFYSPPAPAVSSDQPSVSDASVPSTTEDGNDADLEPAERPPEDQEEEMEEQMAADGEDSWQADPGRAPLSKSTSGPSGVFSFPFFVRLESVVYPKGSITQDEDSTSSEGPLGSSKRQGRPTAPISIGSAASQTHSYQSQQPKPIAVAPTLTLPTPRNQQSFNASSNSAAKMTLRLVCVVLPRHSSSSSSSPGDLPGSSPASFSGESPATMSSVLDRPAGTETLQSEYPSYSRLPKAIRGILHDVKRCIRSVVAQQVLISLREKVPVSKNLVEAVQYYMAYLHMPALSRYSVPLWFHDPREGRNLFLLELEHSTSFKVERVDRNFVVVRPNKPAEGGQAPTAPYAIPHWMLLTVLDDKVKIKFNSLRDRDEKLKIYREIRNGIRAINDRVNQLCLLYQLYETRMCSILLVPVADQDTKLSASDNNLSAPQSGGIKLTYPSGHFACPMVHEFRLPVFHRLDPREAEAALVAAALHHFSVSNRSNMYVIREQNGNIFYILLSLVQEASTSAPDQKHASSLQTRNFLHFKVYGVNSPTKEITQDLPALLESKLADKALQSLTKLLLRNPLLKLTPADVELLKPADQRPKRFSALIPKCVADVHLFFGYLKQTVTKQQLSLLNFTAEVQPFTDDLSNEFIYNNLIPLPNLPAKLNFGPGVACVAFSMKGSGSGEPDPSLNPMQELRTCTYEEVKLSEMPESTTTNLDELRGAVTKKLEERKQQKLAQTSGFSDALISLWLRGKSASPIVTTAVQMWLNDEPMEEKAMQNAATALMQEVSDTLEEKDSGQYRVEVQIWTRGTLKLESLLEHLNGVINQTSVEYQFEMYHGAVVDSLSAGSVGTFVARSYELFSKGSGLGMTGIRSLNSTDVVVPSWAMNHLLVELQDLVKESSGNLYPNLYMNLRPHNTLPVMSFTQMGQDRAAQVAAMEAEARAMGAIVVQPGTGVSSMGQMTDPCVEDSFVPFTVTNKITQNLADPSGLLMSKNRTRFVIIASKQHNIAQQASGDSTQQVPADLPFSWAASNAAPSISSSSSPNAPIHGSSSMVKSNSNASIPAASAPATTAVATKLQTRRSFGMIVVSANQLCLMTYNWNPGNSETLLANATRLQDWLRLRLHLLNNILHQKMGLFHHLPRIPESHFNAAFTSGGAPIGMLPPPRAASIVSSVSNTEGAPSPVGSGASASQNRGPDPMAARGAMMKFNRFKVQRPGDGIQPSGSKDSIQPAASSQNLERSSSQTSANVPRSSSGPGTAASAPQVSASNPATSAENSSPATSAASDVPRHFRFDSQFESLMTSFVPPRGSPSTPEVKKAKLKQKTSQPTTPVSSPANSSSGLETVMFDSILKRASPAILPARKHDPVQRHALQIKQLAQRQQRLSQPSRILSNVYQLWARTQEQQQHPRDQSIDEDTLSTLLKTCRLHNACRVPFFIADLYKRDSGLLFAVPPPDHRLPDQKQETEPLKQDSTPPKSESSTSSTAKHRFGPMFIGPEQRLKLDSPPIPSACLGTKSQIDARRKWRQNLLEKFVEDYGKYLQTFGLARVDIRSSETVPTDSANSTQSSGYQKFEIYPESKTIYFQKVFRGGLLLVALGWDGAFVTATLYSKFSYAHASAAPVSLAESPSLNPTATTTGLFGAIAGSVDELRRRVSRQIRTHTEEAARLKDALHMNSFVYDFHIRQMSEFFEQGQPGDYPGDELVNLMQSMVFYYQGPKHARNSIRTSSFTVELGRSQLSPVEIFAFLSQNANKYNMYSSGERGLSPGVFMVSSSSEMVNKPRNRNGQLLEQLEEETFTLLAFITDSSVSGGPNGLPESNSDNSNLVCQLGSWKKYFPDATTQLARPKQGQPPQIVTPVASLSANSSRNSSISSGTALVAENGSRPERSGSSPQAATGSAIPAAASNDKQSQLLSTASFRNLASFLSGPQQQQAPRATAPASSMASTKNLREITDRGATGIFSAFLSKDTAPPPAVAPVEPVPEKLRCFDIAFFVLRRNKGTIFPLSNVSQRLSTKGQSTVAAVQAIVQQPEMHEAITKSRLRLMESTQQAFVHSERDMLWTRLTREGSAADAALTEEQFRMLSKLVEMRSVEEMDPTLKDMFSLTVDWNALFQHLINSFGNRSRRFFFDGVAHLLLFSASDRDSIMYLTLNTTANQVPNTCPVEMFVCRREIRTTSIPYKMAQAEASLLSSVINTILHWMWRSMVIRDRRPRQ